MVVIFAHIGMLMGNNWTSIEVYYRNLNILSSAQAHCSSSGCSSTRSATSANKPQLTRSNPISCFRLYPAFSNNVISSMLVLTAAVPAFSEARRMSSFMINASSACLAAIRSGSRSAPARPAQLSTTSAACTKDWRSSCGKSRPD